MIKLRFYLKNAVLMIKYDYVTHVFGRGAKPKELCK
jgi:hypothetical protein